MQVIGYVRVSTDEQGESEAGIAAQRAAITAECERRGWQLLNVVEDPGYSAKDLRTCGGRAFRRR
jgi:DNA invertase Pin-like site-specific DNA recombinase